MPESEHAYISSETKKKKEKQTILVCFGNSDRSRENSSVCFLLEFKLHGLVSPVDRWRCDMLLVLACVSHLLVIYPIDLLH